MDQRTLVAIVVLVVIAILLVAVIVVSRQRRRQRLKEHYGPEYDRAVQNRGDAGKAELELLKREERVHKFSIKPLAPEARAAYAEEWSVVQRRFVDDPAKAVTEANALVNRVMKARGYPTADFDQRAADISVTYPGVVENYRSARTIAQRHARGEAGTEDLRQAMVLYRSLFDELLDTPKSAAVPRGVIDERIERAS
jgi:type II secretory pathway pseudopilin PulG